MYSICPTQALACSVTENDVIFMNSGGVTIWVRVCLTPHEAPLQLYCDINICVVKTGIPVENREYTAHD